MSDSERNGDRDQEQQKLPGWVLPLATGFGGVLVAALAQLTPAMVQYLALDQEQQVFEATMAERARLVQAQSNVLALQAQLLERLRALAKAEADNRTLSDKLKKQQSATKLAQRSTQVAQAEFLSQLAQVRSGEARCVARRQAARRATKAKAAEAERQDRKIAPYAAHRCRSGLDVDSKILPDGNGRCVFGNFVTFAQGTSDERQFLVPQPHVVPASEIAALKGPSLDELAVVRMACRAEPQPRKHVEKAEAMCRHHQWAFMSAKGLSKADLEALRSLWVLEMVRSIGAQKD